MSVLSKARIKDEVILPDVFSSQKFYLKASRRYAHHSELVKSKIVD